MKYAILSDIHANLEALEVALDSMARIGAERAICLGDAVGYGANPNRCVDLIREKCEVAIQGNHDSAVVGTTSTVTFTRRAQLSTDWTRDRLTPENLKWLKALPLSWTDDRFRAVHSSPLDPMEWYYVLQQSMANDAFHSFSERLCFLGHSHVPILFRESGREGEVPGETETKLNEGDRYLINIGSVGQPRDGDPRLAYGLYDSDRHTIRIVREEYDHESASRKIIDAGLPEELGKRLIFGM